jgi:DNA-binding LacI/PurR family transcriptional regulator
MGERAMQELLKRFENPNAPAEVVRFETSLIIRRSSGPLSEGMLQKF